MQANTERRNCSSGEMWRAGAPSWVCGPLSQGTLPNKVLIRAMVVLSFACVAQALLPVRFQRRDAACRVSTEMLLSSGNRRRKLYCRTRVDTRSRATALEVASIFATDEIILPGNQRPR